MSRLRSFLFGGKKTSAAVAAERLQFILARQRPHGSRAAAPDYLPALQQELIAVISRYARIHPDDVKVQCEMQGDIEMLEVKVELPQAC